MARWTKSCENSRSTPATPTSRKSSSEPPVKRKKTHDRRAHLFADAVGQEPAAHEAAPAEKAQVSGRRGGWSRLFLFLFLSRTVCRTQFDRDSGGRCSARDIAALRIDRCVGVVPDGAVGLDFSARTRGAAVQRGGNRFFVSRTRHAEDVDSLQTAPIANRDPVHHVIPDPGERAVRPGGQ